MLRDKAVCIPDPLEVIRNLVARGHIRGEQLNSLNDDLVVIGLEPIGEKAEVSALPLPAAATRRRAMRKESSADVSPT